MLNNTTKKIFISATITITIVVIITLIGVKISETFS